MHLERANERIKGLLLSYLQLSVSVAAFWFISAFVVLFSSFLKKEHSTLFSPHCYPPWHSLCPLIIREGTLRFLQWSSANVLCKWRKHLEGAIFLLMFSLNPPVNQISSFLFYVGVPLIRYSLPCTLHFFGSVISRGKKLPIARKLCFTNSFKNISLKSAEI